MLRVIADEAGLPESAGGCFVSGGSAGNLSALAVARETAKADSVTGRRARGCGWSSAATRTPRSSTRCACWRCRRWWLTPGPSAHGRCGEPRSTQIRISATSPRCLHLGNDQRGIIDDLAGVGEIAKDRGWWFHVDGAYGGSGSLPDRCAQVRRHRAGRLVHPRPAQVALHPSTAVRLSTGNLSSPELPILRTLPT